MSFDITGQAPVSGERVLVIPHRPAGSTGDPLSGTIARLTRRNDTLVELAGVCRGRIRKGTGSSGPGQETADVDAVDAPPDPVAAGYLRGALDELAGLDERSGISKGMFDEMGADASLLADLVALVLQLAPDERLALLDLEDPAARARGAAARIDAARADARDRVDRRKRGAGAARVRAVLEEFARDNLAYDEMEAIPVEDEATVDALIAGLSSAEWRAVMACTRQLGRATVAREKAVGTLRLQLDHAEDLVSQAAVEALGDLGRHAAAAAAAPDLLAKLLEGEDLEGRGLFVVEIFRALGKIGGAAAARETAAFVEACLPETTSFHGLAAYRRERGAAPGEPPIPPEWAKEGAIYDGFGLVHAACEALGKMDDARHLALPALRAAARSTRADEKSRTAAACGMARLDRSDAGVAAVLALVVNSTGLHEPDVLDALFEGGVAFPLVVSELVIAGHGGTASYQDPTPALARFVAHVSFAGAGYDTLRVLLRSPDPRMRRESAELAGFLRDGSPLLAPLRARLVDEERSVTLAAAAALTRLRDTSEDTRQGLRNLLAKITGDADAEDRLRDALAVLGAPVPAPAGESAADRSLGFFALPGVRSDAPRLDGSTLYVPWQDSVPPPDPESWNTDADRLGLLRVDLSNDSPIVTEEIVPLDLPVRRTGASGAKRRLAILARLPEGLLVSIRSPFSDHRGWGNDTFLLVFDPVARTWSWLAKADAAPGYALSWIDGVDRELPSRSVAGGELILWMDAGRLRIETDGTPYHLDDWSHADATSAALASQRVWREAEAVAGAAKEVEGISVHRWVADGEVIRDVQRFVIESDPRIPPNGLASLSPAGFFTVRVGKIPALAMLVCATLTNGERKDSLAVLRRASSI